VWQAFTNRYWPALYVADAKGVIRFHHFGEGNYERSERVLQQLLVEIGSWSFDEDLVSVDASGDEAAPDWNALKAPETYVGYDRTHGFASPGGLVLHESHRYSAPADLGLNE
jgi:hypothetical protein